ncbi:uncharacterized protein LOC129719976 [Wyeomyia smithii]|uniref:uncharacterized protein LOC129719976 n=1 Tax=Wyeomyia smithii TaxID=174621 RepID=UPI002467DA37|nr:uncharacterized protein LOC129719976 [Wyeomyia smithii]
MSLICHSCANDINESHVICRGFCSAVFHPRCTGIAAVAFEDVMKNAQLFWLCKSCTSLIKDIRVRNATRSAHEAGLEEALNTHSGIMENLKAEILNELKNEIRTNFATLMNSNSFTPRSIRRTATDSRFSKPRRLFNADTNRSNKPLLLHGTGSTPSASTEIAVVPAARRKFCLYLSRIARKVSVE